MGREAQSIPARWKEQGVLYVVNVGDNQTKWLEYKELRDNNSRTPDEDKRLAELEPEIDDLFVVRIGPYSHDEYMKIQSKIIKKHFQVKVDKKQNAEVLGDPAEAGELAIQEVCSERIYEVVSGYQIAEPTLDANGEPQHDEEGKLIATRTRPKTGKELVEFIVNKAWDTEQEVLADCYNAIRERSHLERGQKKTWLNARGS